LEDFAPVSFIDQSWDNYVYDKGEISKKYYELCTLWELREQLRRRNIYVQKSEKYCNYQEILLTDEEMTLQQDGILKSLNLSFDFSQKQKELTNNWIESVKTVASTVKARSKSQEQYFEIVNDEIRLKADDALDLPEGIKAFINLIKEGMTVIDLPDLVMEMGIKYNFTDNLTHINNGKPAKDLEDIIKNYIVLYGNACNLTETDMERTTSLNRHQFSHHQQWYYTMDSLKKINDGLVNALYQQPLAKFWGDGTMSSSDGQKFMVSVRSIHSTANQKYFFVKKGLNSYTWTADIFAQFGSKLISATEKEATYILDMILDNETELRIEEHTGDEGAYTDLIFALFDLFGLMFCSRLGSLHKKTLLSISGATDISKIKDIFSRPVNFALIERNWKEILRVVCSIKSGKVPCSVFVSKLQILNKKTNY
jgi:Tn3 transposase DDE domain